MCRVTLTEILPSSLGKCAARNQSPGSGLVTLNAPVVRFGRVQVSVTAKDPGTTVSRGKLVYRGLITGGAPDLKYLLNHKATIHSLCVCIFIASRGICRMQNPSVRTADGGRTEGILPSTPLITIPCPPRSNVIIKSMGTVTWKKSPPM